MDQMSTILNATLVKSGCPMLAINTETVGKLISLFRYERETYLMNHFASYIQNLGKKLQEGSYRKMAMNLSVRVCRTMSFFPDRENCGNHWAGVVIDVPAKTIWYADSLRFPPPDEWTAIMT